MNENSALRIIKQIIGVNNPDVEDIMQELRIKLWQNRDRIENLNSFACRIARNESITYLRKKVPLVAFDWLIDNESYEENIVDRIELEKRFEEIIKGLKYSERELILLRIKGYSVKEVSEILDIPLGTVKSLTFRITQNNPELAFLLRGHVYIR